MTTTDLRRARDAAFEQWLSVKRSGGKSSRKLALLVKWTLALHRAQQAQKQEAA
jgi:hypothetical protein